MTEKHPRIEERAALEAICGIEDVSSFEWLSERNVPTPDLRVKFKNGSEATVEITMATNVAARQLRGAERKMRKKSARELAYDWTITVSELAVSERPSRQSLKKLRDAAISVLAEVESQGGTPEAMQTRANNILNPDLIRRSYDLNNLCVRAVYQHTQLKVQGYEKSFDDWARTDRAENDDYWYPPDIADYLIDNLQPRIVRAIKPLEVAGKNSGSIDVRTLIPSDISGSSTRDLSDALNKAIEKKEAKGQMENAKGKKWLIVALEGKRAVTQLEDSFGPEVKQSYPDLAEVEFSIFDEVWALCTTFHKDHRIVLRMSDHGQVQRVHHLPRLNSA